MRNVPFTVKADLDLGTRIISYLSDTSADVLIEEGPVPERLSSPSHEGVSYAINDTQVLLAVPQGARYLIEGGERIIYERNGKSDREVALFLLGSAWGALCYQRSLLPLHASAVLINDRVHAFTGPSGAGKSTLAAALAQRGFSFFTDDVLIIDPAELGRQTPCYSGRKDLKLWEDALTLTNSERIGAIRDIASFAKFYAFPQSSTEATVGTLTTLSILKNDGVRRGQDPVTIAPVLGAEALINLRQSVYRPRYATAILGLPKYYQILSKLIASVEIHSFDRLLEKQQFDATTNHLADWLRAFPAADTTPAVSV